MSTVTEKDQELIQFAYNHLKLNIPKGHQAYENMISGIPYTPWDEQLNLAREDAHQYAREYSQLSYRGKTIDQFNKERVDVLKKFIGEVKGTATIEAPFSVDYGFNTSIGNNFYANFNLTLLDSSIIRIGDDVEFGPNVVLCCAGHPTNPFERLSEKGEFSKQINIGNKVWLGSNVTVLPGVTIGDGVVVGANSVVNKDLPSYTVCVGAPCKVIKQIDLEDN